MPLTQCHDKLAIILSTQLARVSLRRAHVCCQVTSTPAPKCPRCDKRVYMDTRVLDGKGRAFHKACLKCEVRVPILHSGGHHCRHTRRRDARPFGFHRRSLDSTIIYMAILAGMLALASTASETLRGGPDRKRLLLRQASRGGEVCPREAHNHAASDPSRRCCDPLSIIRARDDTMCHVAEV